MALQASHVRGLGGSCFRQFRNRLPPAGQTKPLASHRATFHLPAGASRPIFVSAFYPLGDGVSAGAIEEGQLVGAFGRTATATIQFDIDEHGVPVNFEVEKSSAEGWGPEAIRITRAWRFKPGTNDGKPVVVPAAFAFAWGQKQLPASKEAEKPYRGDLIVPTTP